MDTPVYPQAGAELARKRRELAPEPPRLIGVVCHGSLWPRR